MDDYAAGELPSRYKDNKLKWCAMLMKAAPLQKFHM